MSLSQKSISFARKILKHNQHQSNHSQHPHQHTSTCSHHHQPQPIAPYLHVHDHRKQRQIYQKPTQQKLQNMRIFKDQGNQYFKNKQYREALHYYHKVVVFGDYTFPDKQKEQKEMDELVQQASCNMAMALVKLGEIDKALENLIVAVKGPLVKTIKKSYYWMCKCYILKLDFAKAKQTIEKMKSLEQNTVDQIKQLQNQLIQAQLTYQKSSKNLFGQMFTNKQTVN